MLINFGKYNLQEFILNYELLTSWINLKKAKTTPTAMAIIRFSKTVINITIENTSKSEIGSFLNTGKIR